MREIKFRAWDKEKNAFYAPIFEACKGNLDELLVSFSGELIRRTLGQTEHESVFPDRYILTQYTGLKDKNGKEIYEGDIIQFGKGNVSDIDIVVWSENGGGWWTKKGASLHTELTASENDNNPAEIIGNIYENPELVKE